MIPYGDPQDELIRTAAFEHVRMLNLTRDALTSDDLRAGFHFQGQRLPLINPQRGIFKPRQMRFLLSIRTVFPKPGARVWYDDQRRVHQKLYESDQFAEYSFMGTDPEAADNRWMREARDRKVPIIYFIGVAPGRYAAVLPSYIADWDATGLRATVGFGNPTDFVEGRYIDNELARRYGMRAVQQRLHQDSFRLAVINAYSGRCALSGLPEPRLLDAAHIMPDRNELLGQPIVPNGLPLSKLHHAAFDAHLIGVDPDYRIHVSRKLLVQRDGPTLEAMKALHGATLRLPTREKDRPDRERLAIRFADFQPRP